MRLDGSISGVIIGGSNAGEIKEYPLGDFERIIQVDLTGSFRCITVGAAEDVRLDDAIRMASR